MQEQINGLGEPKGGPQRALRPQEKRDTTTTGPGIQSIQSLGLLVVMKE